MSIPDHGEYDHIGDPNKMVPERNMIDMGRTFLDLYLEDGDKLNFDAALTLLGRAYHRTFAPVPAIGLAQEIEKAAAPIQHEPHFGDKAEPGQVVPVTLIKPLIPPIDEQDE